MLYLFYLVRYFDSLVAHLRCWTLLFNMNCMLILFAWSLNLPVIIAGEKKFLLSVDFFQGYVLLAFSPLYSFSFFLTLFLSFPFVSVHHDGKISGFIKKKKKGKVKPQTVPPSKKEMFKQCQMAFLLSDLSVRVFCWPLYQNRQPAWQPSQPERRVSWIWLRKRYFLPSFHSNELVQGKGRPGEKKSSPWWLWPCLLVREVQTGQQR